MRLAENRAVKIIVLGAGGTGGYVIPHLYRIAAASNRPCRVILADGDVVEPKNLVRQNFADCDIGANKAAVMAQRYSGVFGIETEYIPEYIEDEAMLERLLHNHWSRWDGRPKPISILIGAVDNNRSRVMCHNVFNRMDDIIYIDSGNGEFTGQVVCGVKMSGRVISKPVARVFPDVLKNTEKFPSELSCAERSISAPQSVAANMFAATAIASMLYYLLVEGNLQNMRISFSSRKLLMKSVA